MSGILLNLYLKLVSWPVLADNNVVNAVNGLIYDIIGKVKIIVTPVASLCAIICGVKLLMASDPQSVRSAKTWLITIIVALAVVYLAPTLITTIISIVEQY